MVNCDSAPESGSLTSGRWSLRLIGAFELRKLDGGVKAILPGKRERALLAYLALSPKGRQPRRKLAAFLWGDATDETLLDNLRTCVWRLRKALGEGAHRLLASDDEDIVLDLPAFDIDVLVFRRLAGEGNRNELEKAVGLLGGDFLQGLELDNEPFESWRRMEASRHLDQAVDVLCRLMRVYAENAEGERAIETGAKILQFDPLNETAARQLMGLYAESGRRGAALQLYHTLSEALRREFNAQPEAATKQVFATIAHAEKEIAVGGGALVETSVEANSAMEAADAPTEIRQPSNPVRDPPAPPQPVVQPDSSPAHTRRWGFAAFAVSLVVTLVLASYWWKAPAPPVATPSARAPAPAAASRAANQGASITVAVLAFDNLSGDSGLQSFSDGMSGEISAALNRMPGLKLVTPGAAVQLSRQADKRMVDVTPGARYLVRGGVRFARNRVQVSAQLIRTDTGASQWSESYERELIDVSTVRTDIATAIAEALKAPLGLRPAAQTASGNGIDPKSYEQFLRAKDMARGRFTGVPEAIKILEPLVARNAGYAPAWALLATCYSMIPAFVNPQDVQERQRRIKIFFPLAQEAAHRAIGLDPNLADPYLALIHVEIFSAQLIAAEDDISRALALEPGSPDVLQLQMELYANIGYRKKALAIAERLHAMAPEVRSWQEDAAEVMWENGQTDAAIEMMKSLVDRPSGPTSLAMMYASAGRYNDAADVLETALKGPGTLPETWPVSFRTAIDLLRKAPSKSAFPPGFPSLDRVGFVYLYVGAPEHALDSYEQYIKSGMKGGGDLFSYLWHASYAPTRKTESFKRFARDAGFVAYWRQRGWPDLCRPNGSDDFVCD